MSTSIRTLGFASLATVLLAACGDAPSEQETAADVSTRKPAAASAPGLPPEMVAAVPAGRSSTVISVHFALGAAPEVNKALPVEIAIVPLQDFAAVRATFEGVEGLALTSGDTLAAAEPKANSTIKHQLVLLPTVEGVYMISTTVETDAPGGGTISRVFSLPIIVAGAEPAPAATPTPAKPANG